MGECNRWTRCGAGNGGGINSAANLRGVGSKLYCFLFPDVQTKEIDTRLERQNIQNNASIRLRNSLPGRFIPNILPIPHLLDGSINKNIGKIKRRLDNL